MKRFKTILFILGACILAILSKVFLPSSVNVEDFDSALVLMLGFPIVACLYFLMIYTQNAVIAKRFTTKSRLSNFQCGLRIGLSFGLIYLIAMQEVVIETSPFSSWGLPFVAYQFAMGIGEALMAVVLCICISCFTVEKKSSAEKMPFKASVKSNLPIILIIAAVFFIERITLYKIGFISSDIKTFPVPTYIWTFTFGLTLGISFSLLKSVIGNSEKPVKSYIQICVFAIGLCWLGFNLFIAFIYKDSLADLILRCGIDIILITLTTVFYYNLNKQKP